jgi:hypothetical protein
MKAVRSVETSRIINPATQHNNQEHLNPQRRRCFKFQQDQDHYNLVWRLAGGMYIGQKMVMCQTVVFGEQLFSVLDDIQAVPYTHAMYM